MSLLRAVRAIGRTPRLLRPAATLLGLVALVAFDARVGGQQSLPSSGSPVAHAIVPGQSMARELTTGQSHTYQLAVPAGHFLRVAITPAGINVGASLRAPDGRVLVGVDAFDDAFREEVIVAIPETPGQYTVDVRASERSEPSGRYTLVVKELRPATADDERRVEAERLFVQGVEQRARNQADGWRAAIVTLDAALEHYRRLGDRTGEMKSLLEKGRALYQLSPADALASAEASERLARELGDRAATARVLLLLASIVDVAGDAPTALARFRESTAISRALGNRDAAANSLMAEGLVLRRRGETEDALTRFDEALRLVRAVRDTRLEAGILNNIGLVYKNLGEYEKALPAYEQSFTNRRAAGDVQGQLPGLVNLATLHGLMGNHQKAVDLHMEAVALARQTGSRRIEAGALDDAGTTLERMRDYDKALAYHREALDVVRQLRDVRFEAAALEGVGRTLFHMQRIDEAASTLQEALTLDRRVQLPFGERNVLYQLAALERSRGNLTAATAHARATVDLDEALRTNITSPELRASFIASEQQPYELLIDLLQEQHAIDRPGSGHDRAALEVSERARARVLLDSLLDARVDLREGVESALLERERSLQRELNDASTQLSRMLAAGSGTDAAAKAAQRVNQLTTQYQELQAQIRRQSPHYASVTLPQPLLAADIQERVVDDETVLLEFALGEERSWLWMVTPDAIDTVPLPARAVIEKAVRSLYAAVTARTRAPKEDGAAYARRMQRADARFERERVAVGELLLGGVAGRLDAEWRRKRLAIVATGVLEYVPFAALVPPVASTPAARSGTPRVAGVSLAARHEIVQIPSASVLDALRRETSGRPPAARVLAVVADPVFELTDPRVMRLAPRSSQSDPGGASRSVVPVGSSADRGSLVRLPFSRDEATAIASLAGPGQTFVATDFRASRTTVLRGSLRGYRAVHFATHGVFDTSSPALSGLVMSLVDERGEPQDGFLRLNDIYNMRLDADLVVLSACQTALGREIKGEGLVGLARAFMYAGAPRVVASLWQMSDLATAELMKKFYRGVLTQGLRPAAALRAAQLEMSADPRWKSPYYWAGFVLQGDWRR